METRSFVRGVVLGGAIAGLCVCLVAPDGFAGRAQAQTTRATSPVTQTSAVGVSQQSSSGAQAPCWDERDSVDAEKNYPGPLLDMAKDDLAKCEAKAQAAK